MKTIELNHGYETIVDDEDFNWLNQYTWRVRLHKGRVKRVLRGVRITDYVEDWTRGDTIFMHRQILGLPKGSRIIIDHINRNPLDNRKQNLKFTTHGDNARNSKVRNTSKSGFKGVTNRTDRPNRFKAQIYLGTFLTAEEAARAYDRAVYLIFGNDYYFNFPDELDKS